MKKEQMENKSGIKNKYIFIAILLIILAAVFSVYLINKNKTEEYGIAYAKEMQAKQGADEYLYEVPYFNNAAKITGTTLDRVIDGTGPFDEDDEPGNDSNSSNGIVRTLDYVFYKTNVAIEINNNANIDGIDMSKIKSIKGGRIKVEAQLSKVGEDPVSEVVWDLDSMLFLEDAVLSEDKTKLEGYIQLSPDKVTVPGSQEVQLVAKVLYAKNADEFTCNINYSMEGNTPKDAINVDYGKQIISAKFGFVISIHDTAQLGYSRIDPGKYPNDETLYGNNDVINGNFFNFGVQGSLYNPHKPEKRMKGIEVPKGDIKYTFDVRLKQVTKEGEVDVTDDVDIRLFDWNKNKNTSSGYYKRIHRALRHAYRHNQSRDDDYPYTMAKENGRWVYNGGKPILTETSTTTFDMSISGYDFNPRDTDIIRDASGVTWYDIRTKNYRPIFSHYFVFFVPDTLEVDGLTNFYFDFELKSMEIVSKSGDIYNKSTNVIQEYSKPKEVRNLKRVNFLKSNPGSFYKDLFIYNMNKVVIGYPQSSSVSEGGEFLVNTHIGNIRLATQEYQMSRLKWLVTIDPEYVEKVDLHSYDIGTKETQKVQWVAKKDGTNWIDNVEQSRAEVDDYEKFEYYDSQQELEATGKLCVGIQFENLEEEYDDLQKNFTFANAFVYVKLKNKIAEGTMVPFTNHAKYWIRRDGPESENWYAKYGNLYFKYRTDSPDQTYNYRDFEPGGYDENGNRVLTANTLYHAGNAVQIQNYKAIISTKPSFTEEQSTKNVYNLNLEENKVWYTINGNITTQSDSYVDSTTANLKYYLPEGLEYIETTAKYGGEFIQEERHPETGALIKEAYVEGGQDITPQVREVTRGGKTYQELTFQLENVKVNQGIPPIYLQTAVDLLTPNNTNFETRALIETPLVQRPEVEREDKTNVVILSTGAVKIVKGVGERFIEANDLTSDINYSIRLINMNESILEGIQVLDVLPYNDDGRGSNITGSYGIKDIVLKDTTLDLAGDIYIAENYVNINGNNEKKYFDQSELDTFLKLDKVQDGANVRYVIPENLKEVTKDTTVNDTLAIVYAGDVQRESENNIDIVLRRTESTKDDVFSNKSRLMFSKTSTPINTQDVTVRVAQRNISGLAWIDTNADGKRDANEQILPGMKIELLNSNNDVVEETITDSEGKYSFNMVSAGDYKINFNIPDEKARYTFTKYKAEGVSGLVNSDGKSITEKIAQTEIIKMPALSEMQSSFYEETNIDVGIVEILDDITVRKLWVNGNPDSRPDVELVLYKQEQGKEKQEVENVILTAGKTEYTFRSMPILDSNLNKIEYTVDERQVPQNYSKTIDNNNLTVTNTYVIPKTNYTVNKTWVGGLTNKPNIQIQLKRDGVNFGEPVTLSSGNTSYTWSDLDKTDQNGKEYVYTADEVNIPENYTKKTTHDQVNNVSNITNTYVSPKTEHTVNKIWINGETRRKNIQVQLLRDGSPLGEPITLTPEQKTYTWKNLDVTDSNANKYIYSAKELDVLENFTSKVENINETNTTNITNTYNIPKIDIEITKEWVDGEYVRPEKITIELLKDGEVLQEKDLITSENKVSFEGLDETDVTGKTYNYTVREKEVPEEFEEEVIGNLIVNTFKSKLRDVTATKTWIGGENVREDVIFQLYRNGEKYLEPVTVKNGVDEYIWENLLDKDKTGTPYVYTVKEVNSITNFEKLEEDLSVTNTYVIPKINISVNKTWINGDIIKPEITLNLVRDGEVIEQQTLINGHLEHTWYNLDKTDETGREYKYSVTENEVENYETEYSNMEVLNSSENSLETYMFNITNTYLPPKMNINVKKIWDGGDSIKPTIKVNLFKLIGTEKELVDTVELKSGMLEHSFVDIDETDLNGKRIEYFVEEEILGQENKRYGIYTVEEIKEKSDENENIIFEITNTYVPEKIDVKGRKVWIGAGGRKPAIYVQLYRDGVKFGKPVRFENGTEEYIWKNLDKTDKDMNKYKYTIDELEVPAGYIKSLSSDGLTITNTRDTSKMILPFAGTISPIMLAILGLGIYLIFTKVIYKKDIDSRKGKNGYKFS